MQQAKSIGAAILLLISFAHTVRSQQLKLGNNPYTIEKSAILELQSTNQGLLFTRIADTLLINALNPQDGMVIFFTPTKQLLLRSNGAWRTVLYNGNAITSLNGLTATTQTFATGTTGTDFNIVSAGTVHTFNIPDASPSARGLLTTGTQTLAGPKTFTSAPLFSSLTQGSIPFIGTGGQLSQSNPNFFYDATNNRVGVGTTAPFTKLHVVGANPLTLTGVQLGTSTTADSLLTITNGLVRKLPMSTFATPITTGNLTEATSSILTITGGTGAVIGSGTTIQVKQANSTQSGFLSATDWSTFNNKLSSVDTTNIPNFSLKVRSLFGAGTGLSYNQATGVFTNTGVTSLNGNTGALTMDTTYISNFSTKVRGLFAAGTGINYDASTGTFSSSINTANFWSLGGNNVTSLQNFGTTSNFALPFITNNIESMRLTAAGSLGIGTTTPSTKLHVVGTNPLTLTGVQLGTSTTADSLLTITNGLVRKLPMSTFATPITTGNLTETGSSILTITGGTGAVIGSGTTLQVKQANASQSGFLSSTDWSTFNNKLSSIDTTNIASFSVKVRSLFGAGTGLNYNTATGIFTNTGVTSLNGNTGALTMDTTYISSFSTKVRGLFAAGTGINYDASSGTISSSINTANFWSLGGNNVTSVQNFGTTSNFALPFITNNTEAMRLTATGSLGIGTTAPSTKLHVVGTNPLTLTGVQLGTSTTADSLLTITNGLVRKLPMSTFSTPITTGNLTETGSSILTITGGTGAVVGSGTSILVKQANASQSGFLSSTDWNTFNNKLSSIDTTNIASFSAKVRSLFGAGTGLSYNQASGIFTNTGVTSLNGNTGALTMDTTYISTFSNKVRSLFGAGTGISYNQATGVISATGSTTGWLLTGNAGTAPATNFIGTTDAQALVTRTNNLERMRIDASGHVGIGITNPANPLVVKDTLEIRRTGTLSTLLFTNTAGTGDFRIGGDGGDIFWQGGGGRALQMGAFWGITLGGDRQTGTFPSLVNGSGNTNVTIQNQRDASIGLAIQGNSATQTGNLTEWRNSSGTILSAVDRLGRFGIGTSSINNTLEVAGTIAATGVSGLRLTGLGTATTGTANSKVLSINSSGDVIVTNFPANTAWSLTGNSGTTPATNFLGTTDAQSLAFRTNNTEAMRIDGSGNLGIANTAPTEKLDITGNLKFSGALMPNNTAGTTGNILQSNGTGAAPTWVTPASALNSTAWLLGGNNVASAQNLGTTSNFALPFITNNVERARISSTGFFGLGTNAPAGRLHLSNDNSELGNDYIFDDYGAATTQGFYIRKARGTFASPSNVANGDILGMIRITGRTSGAFSFTGGSGMDAYYKGSGTNDLTDLRFFTSNTERVRIDESGNLAIGATSFDATNPEQLLVDAGTTSSVNAIYAKGSINSYFQINIQNQSTGTQSSSDLVATANNGTETTNFVNLGINGSAFQYQTGNPIETGKANDGYLISAGNDFYIVNNNTLGKDMIFLTGGTAASNEVMRLTSTERVGIGTTAPSAILDVANTFKLGAKGSVNKNSISFSASIPGNPTALGGTMSVLIPNSFVASSTNVDITIPSANQPTSTQATVVVSPAFDLPTSVSIASARLLNTTTVRVRFVNASTANQNLSGTLYFTITEF